MAYRQNNDKRVMYIYDRVCTKASKKSEIERHFPRDRRGYSKPRGYIKELFVSLILRIDRAIEEKKQDKEFMRRRARIMKKISDYKNALIAAVILLPVAALMLLGVYKLLFVVRNIGVEGASTYSATEVMKATGIKEGVNIFSFDPDEAGARVSFYCPYIKSAKVTRQIPTSVTVTVEEDTAALYTTVYGDTVILSPTLRVLSVGEADTEGLCEVVLPGVKRCVAGDVIEFTAERDGRFIRDTVAVMLKSAIVGEGTVTKIDLSDQHNITAVASGKYLLYIGGEADLGLKLKMGEKTIKSGSLETDTKAGIDLSVVGEATVVYDRNLELE